MIVSSDDSCYIGWVETAIGMHTFSIRPIAWGVNSASTSAATKLDLSTLSVDDELEVLLEGIKRKDWFIERLKGAKSPDIFARELQEMVSEVIDKHNQTILRQSTTSSAALLAGGGTGVKSGGDKTSSGLRSDAQSCISLFLHSGGTREKSLPRTIIQHIGALGWENVIKVSEDLSTLTLRVWDGPRNSNGLDVTASTSASSDTTIIPSKIGTRVMSSITRVAREHSIEVSIPPSYPSTSPQVSGNVPGVIIPITWPPYHNNDLISLVKSVGDVLQGLALYFDTLIDLDSNAWVLEPTVGSYHTPYRRLVIDSSASLLVEINPHAPHVVSNITFMGPPARVKAFKEAWRRNGGLSAAAAAAAGSNGTSFRDDGGSDGGGGGGGGQDQGINNNMEDNKDDAAGGGEGERDDEGRRRKKSRRQENTLNGSR